MAPCRASSTSERWTRGPRSPARRRRRRRPAGDRPRHRSAATAGDRAVARALLQRDGPKTPVNPRAADPPARALNEFDPAEWAAKVAPIVRSYGISGTIVTLASNTSYAFDADGGSLREIPVHVGTDLRRWSTAVARAGDRRAARDTGSVRVLARPRRDPRPRRPLPAAAVRPPIAGWE